MKLVKKIAKFLIRTKAKARLRKCKYVHLMFNDKFNKPIVDFLNKNFPHEEHVFLCKRWFAEHPFPVGENVFEVKSYFRKINLDRSNIDKIICHSLFDNEIVEYFYNNPELLRTKAYWVIWGGDLYQAPRDEKNDFVRKNFGGYLATYDECILKEYYQASNIRKIIIPWNITLDMLRGCGHSKPYVQIQINNSCDSSTLEMLHQLSRFSGENVRIVTVTSYGALEFKEEVERTGCKLFGDKFMSLSKWMSPESYVKHLAQNDILILNQDRQQGCGNALVSLYLGVKVFIKSTTTPFRTYQQEGISVYDTLQIKNLSFAEFVDNPTSTVNKSIVQRYFDERYWISLWRDALEG